MVQRIVLVCPYSLALPGGVQAQVLGLARSLRTLGFSASVIGPCDGPPPAPGVIPVGVSIALSANGSVAPVAPDPSAVSRTLAVLRAEQPDVIHLHEPLVPGPCLTSLLSGVAPVVGTFHASGRVPAYEYLRPLVRTVARRLAARTAVSPMARDLAARCLGGTWEVLPNGVDVARFAKADPWPYGLGEQPILFVGRHEPRKGLAVLLDAFRSGLPEGAVLWVAGEGPETAQLRASSPARVEWLGRISDDELARRLRAAAVFCAPSLHGESFGVVLLEAMAAGTPVVASDISGYRDVARADHEAVLVPPGDPLALRRALDTVLRGSDVVVDLAEAGTVRAAGFSIDRLAERYADLYATLT
jgi:phosphatidylinositol alpha-mannosyltransferase